MILGLPVASVTPIWNLVLEDICGGEGRGWQLSVHHAASTRGEGGRWDPDASGFEENH